ncbi:MAG: hypothetical protein JWM64_1451 [Frankiales bacterium]|nr:hypothetical protein [Frankiales bacterium]
MARAGGTPAGLRTAAAVVAVGAVLTAVATVLTAQVHDHSEHRLLVTQTRQAAAVIGATVVQLSSPLDSAVTIAGATDGSPTAFRSFIADYTGDGAPFVAASLWRVAAGGAVQVAAVGVAPAYAPPAVAALVQRAARSETFLVARVDTEPAPRIAYADGDPRDGRFVVYVERAVPADRQVPVESDSAFADLHFASYLGTSARLDALATTDLPLSRLPLRGDTATPQSPSATRASCS